MDVPHIHDDNARLARLPLNDSVVHQPLLPTHLKRERAYSGYISASMLPARMDPPVYAEAEEALLAAQAAEKAAKKKKKKEEKEKEKEKKRKRGEEAAGRPSTESHLGHNAAFESHWQGVGCAKEHRKGNKVPRHARSALDSVWLCLCGCRHSVAR